MKNFKSELKDLYNEGKYDEVISLIDSTDPRYIDSELLVLKGDSIQLSENNPYELTDIEDLYKQAIYFDPNYLDAYMELGFFYYNVLDKEKEAKNIFAFALLMMLGTDNKYLQKFSSDLNLVSNSSHLHALNKYFDAMKSEEHLKKIIYNRFCDVHWGKEIESSIEMLLKEHLKNSYILNDFVKDIDTGYGKSNE
ncbi:MAG: hypothetical protein J0M18_14280 [Ignavibacteria bacterium]|jgi:hypothetical protein|nr:hypothetical protein [Ignavibacteria bacterium]